MRLKTGLLAVVSALAFAVPASANTIHVNLTAVTGAGIGLFDYTYTVRLTELSAIDESTLLSPTVTNTAYTNEAFFVVYDFNGFVSLTATTGLLATDFTFSTPTVGPAPAAMSPIDGPTINLVFNANAGTFVVGPAVLGTFTARSTIGVVGAVQTGSQDTKISAFTPNESVAGTVEGDNGPTAVPEPGSMMLMGTGLFGLAGVVRRRLRRA